VFAPAFHRELLLPPPTEEAPRILPFVWSSTTPFWLEIHREAEGRVRYALGSSSGADLELLLAYLAIYRPRLAAGPSLDCPIYHRVERGVYARAMPLQRHHFLPIGISPDADLAGFLLRTLDSRTLRGHDVVLQVLFQREEYWQFGLLTPRFESVAARQARHLRTEMDARRNLSPYHIELRARISGPQPGVALTALSPWLEWWTTPGGVPWRSWAVVPRKREPEFVRLALAVHGLDRFSCRKGQRDVSALEVAHLLSLPWAERHPACSYSGAPTGRPGPGLVVSPSGLSTIDAASDPRLDIGSSGGRRVGFPSKWNHLAIIGRTQSGKSTLALNLALQLLEKEPDSSVVVIEPTGTLIDGVAARLSQETAADSIEIDPAHATFDRDGTTMVRVPLSLLRQPESVDGSDAARERWAETAASDLLGAIRSAWGEESIGGRAELVLRALVQGLSLTRGSNIVDAYHILSSKPALQRFVKSMRPGPLRGFFEAHLPRLGYDFTMSSLDKVGKIATNPLLRLALCQRSRAVAFDRLLAHRLLLLNLSKSAVGADGANFLGAIYLSQLWAALQRTGRPGRPVYLVLDEVHNYAIPALADMLSEGAKFGLHVVAVTQFLHRIPPRVRDALVGNVDAWLLFSLGAEDIDHAWRIAHGEVHGWRPQDFADGLRAHECALAVSGELVKLEAHPSPPLDPFENTRREAVLASSSRYAQPEDSEASPWLVGQEEVEELLGSVGDRSMTLADLEGETALSAERLQGAIARAISGGDLERTEDGRNVRLTRRGGHHLRVLRARGNEGEDHVETLTEFAVFLESRGIALSVPEQVAGILTPDGQFQWGDATYNVEVECSTVARAAGQVARNVKKARAAGFRVLLVLPDPAAVPRALALLDDSFAGMRLWPDGVGVVWKEGIAAFRPVRVPGTTVWPFLEPGFHMSPADLEFKLSGAPTEPKQTDRLVEDTREAMAAFAATGRKEVTLQEAVAALRVSGEGKATELRVGQILRYLGIPNHRVRTSGGRFRVYELANSDFVARQAWKRTDPDGPTDRPETEVAPAGPAEGSTDRVVDRPSEDLPSDRKNPIGPSG
jgi:hypothetical protein